MLRQPDVFSCLLREFGEIKCDTCINDLIYLEFVRSAVGKRDKDNVERFVSQYVFTLPTDQEIYEIAHTLYPLYNSCGSIRNNRQVSVVDVINASFLKKYGENLFLLTLDNSDYPLEVMDRLIVGAIDAGKQIMTWGIYRFNQERYEEMVGRFESR